MDESELENRFRGAQRLFSSKKLRDFQISGIERCATLNPLPGQCSHVPTAHGVPILNSLTGLIVNPFYDGDTAQNDPDDSQACADAFGLYVVETAAAAEALAGFAAAALAAPSAAVTAAGAGAGLGGGLGAYSVFHQRMAAICGVDAADRPLNDPEPTPTPVPTAASTVRN